MNVFDLQARIGLDTSEYDKNLSSSESKFSNFGSKIAGGVANVAKVAAGATVAAGAATTAFVKSAVDAGAQFDTSMSQVAATMGKTVDEIGDLREFAQKMGSETAFSASQAADALNYMALAGYDAEKSMSMLPTVLDLAAAGSMELATASDMVTDAQSALGLTIDETTIMVNQMAVASSKTNTSVSQLGDAILTVGGTAKNLKGGTQELAQTLGLMADNGIKGSEAGTHLRNIMLAMTPATDAAVAAFEELGLKAYDDNGNLKAMSEIFGDLSNAMDGLTSEERTNKLNAMFNKTDLAAVNALLDTSAERWGEVSDAIGNYEGAASNMATTQLDNLNGSITLFKSAWEGLQIVISDMVTPSLKAFVDYGAEGISKITNAIKDGGLAGGLEAVSDILSDLWSKIKTGITNLLPKLVDAVPEIIKGMVDSFKERINLISEYGPLILTGIVNGIRDNIPVLIDGIMLAINGIKDFITNDLGALIDAGIEIITAISDGLVEALPVLIPAVTELITTLAIKLTDPETIVKLVDATTQIILALADGLVAALPILLDAAPIIIDNLCTAIVKVAPKLLDVAAQLIAKIYNGLNDNLGKIFESGRDILARLILGIIELDAKLRETAQKLVMKFLEGIKERYVKTFETGKEIFSKVKEGIMSVIDGAKTWGKDLIDNFIGGIQEKWNHLKETVGQVAESIRDYLGFSEPKEGPLSNFHTYAPDMMDLYAKGIKDNANKVTNQLEMSLTGVTDFFDSSKSGSAAHTGGTNIYYINVTTEGISSEYGAHRAAQAIAEELGSLQTMQTMAVGG